MWPTLLTSLADFGKDEKQLSEDFVFVLAHADRAVYFLASLMRYDLMKTPLPSAAFLVDNLFSKCFRVWVRLHCLPYLWHALGPPLTRFIMQHQEKNSILWELDARWR